jgi:organic hydroperoxide reductase OsmC/OhrA
MSEYRAAIRWTRESSDFSYDSYDRNHGWKFGSGVEVAASAAPEFRGDPERVNPEEAFVAAIAGCHMLTFLAIAARKRLVVDSYTDKATGYMEKNAAGKLAITRVVLRPQIEFSGASPSGEELDRIHEQAHDHCFIANSVLTSVRVEMEVEVEVEDE